MRGIDVQVTDDGPALFEVVLQDSRGRELELDAHELRDYAEELRELAFGLVHRREVRPLPAGAIRVRVPLDEPELALDDGGEQGWGLGPQIEDVLFNWKITGHYRYTGPKEEAARPQPRGGRR